MFFDEIKRKFGVDLASEFEVVVFGKTAAVLSGIKSVVSFTNAEIRFRTKKSTVVILGENLGLAEIGAAEAYISGKIKDIVIE